jgi:hypothetical protein
MALELRSCKDCGLDFYCGPEANNDVCARVACQGMQRVAGVVWNCSGSTQGFKASKAGPAVVGRSGHTPNVGHNDVTDKGAFPHLTPYDRREIAAELSL